MKRIVGYDRALAVQFFLRTVSGVVNSTEFAHVSVQPSEIGYMATKLAESAVTPQRMGVDSPWFFGSYEELARTVRKTQDQQTLIQAELAANQILILQGVVGSEMVWGYGEAKVTRDVAMVPDLYRHSARARCRTVADAIVLHQMATHAFVWLEILSRISGSDLLAEIVG